MEINLDFLKSKVRLKPVIISISQGVEPKHVSLQDSFFEEDPLDHYECVMEKKDILFHLHVKIDNSDWEIPYLVVLRKYVYGGLKDAGQEIKKYADEDSYLYMMDRYLNLHFPEIVDQDKVNILIDILLIFSTVYRQHIYKEHYLNPYSNMFFLESDIQKLEHHSTLEYQIRKYYTIANNLKELKENRVWGGYSAPHINLCSEKTKNEKILFRMSKDSNNNRVNFCSF